MYIHSTPSTPLLAEKYAEYAGDLSDVHKLHAAPPFFYKLLVGTISGTPARGASHEISALLNSALLYLGCALLNLGSVLGLRNQNSAFFELTIELTIELKISPNYHPR